MFYCTGLHNCHLVGAAGHRHGAERGEQSTMRLREARKRSCNSAVSPPGCMSVGAKNTGSIGRRFHPRSPHNVAGIRYRSSVLCNRFPQAWSCEL